jgi:hypothetical protein
MLGLQSIDSSAHCKKKEERILSPQSAKPLDESRNPGDRLLASE